MFEPITCPTLINANLEYIASYLENVFDKLSTDAYSSSIPTTSFLNIVRSGSIPSEVRSSLLITVKIKSETDQKIVRLDGEW